MTRDWAIALYEGTLYNLKPARKWAYPCLTKDTLPDSQASFVADPFLIFYKEDLYLFFEVMFDTIWKGAIGVAVRDGYTWSFLGIALKERYHLSYPYVWEYRGECYMIPEANASGALKILRATRFPWEWEEHSHVRDTNYADPSILRLDGKWWIFYCGTPRTHDSLHILFADHLEGPWYEHPCNPIIENNPVGARPAGRILVYDGSLVRFGQVCSPFYGKSVLSFEIRKLSKLAYEEGPGVPVLNPAADGWNSRGMHHIDVLHREEGSLFVVDGR